jgi:hypothetical protein
MTAHVTVPHHPIYIVMPYYSSLSKYFYILSVQSLFTGLLHELVCVLQKGIEVST